MSSSARLRFVEKMSPRQTVSGVKSTRGNALDSANAGRHALEKEKRPLRGFQSAIWSPWRLILKIGGRPEIFVSSSQASVPCWNLESAFNLCRRCRLSFGFGSLNSSAAVRTAASSRSMADCEPADSPVRVSITSIAPALSSSPEWLMIRWKPLRVA